MRQHPASASRNDPYFQQRRRLVLSLPAFVCGVAIAAPPVQSDILRIAKNMMGTQLEICLQGRDPAALKLAANAAMQEMDRLSQMMSRFHPTSVVNALHYASGLRPIPVPPELFSVLRMAKERSQQSHGAFDPTVGAYQGWHFDGTHNQSPASSELAQQRQLVDAQHLILDQEHGTAFLQQRGMRLDLGGIAKLPILQAGLRVIESMGIEHAMLNGGGDVFVKGQLNQHPWRIGLRDPRQPERLLGQIELSDGIVAASGDYERYFFEQGQRQHHILNPGTGLPTRGPHGLALVVRHTPSSLKDINGLGAAIMVTGSARGRQMLANLPHIDAFIVNHDQSLWFSEGMKNRLHSLAT
ncbi:FAD:protein FMN transferase [Undibacterium luofuense]|uniref:FAD:protein FMN transferase n=1 Tax=Undibacterium luofuense TaxID=2828733 RepID=A0A941I6B9_9BURK|nr:FAD:protein FMN transferase [Undibacterium luofuense]MBR7781674.1 FAD:protein FMN transferase [Undibacterium luofuense]